MDVSLNYFEITRRGSRSNKSVTLPNSAMLRGIALQESATQTDHDAVPLSELATGASKGMFLTAAVTTTVPSPTVAELAGAPIALSTYESPFRGGEPL
jgi:hypothetical protein